MFGYFQKPHLLFDDRFDGCIYDLLDKQELIGRIRLYQRIFLTTRLSEDRSRYVGDERGVVDR
jgi:hypothetical protein